MKPTRLLSMYACGLVSELAGTVLVNARLRDCREYVAATDVLATADPC